MYQNPLDSFNVVKWGANAIDKAFTDIPFFTNPFAPKAKPTTTSNPNPNPVVKTPTQPNADAAWQQEMSSLNARLQQLQTQLAVQPKLPSFDILGNYNRAKQTATQNVTPLYNQKLNLFLEQQGIAKDTKTKETDLARENNAITNTNTKADNDTSRVRTGQDLASALEMIGRTRGDFLTDSGTAFDEARRGAQDELAAAGGTNTGLGQQAITKQLTDRNTSDSRQLREFSDQEATKNMLSSRTLEDLATGDIRADEKKVQSDKAVQIDFDSAMANFANEEKTKRLDLDLQKALDIASQTDSYSNQGVMQFIASLAGAGWRPQDIALAKQVYG